MVVGATVVVVAMVPVVEAVVGAALVLVDSVAAGASEAALSSRSDAQAAARTSTAAQAKLTECTAAQATRHDQDVAATGQRRSRQAEERKPRPAWPGNAESTVRTLPRVTRLVRVVVDGADAEIAADALWAASPSAVQEEWLDDGRVRLTADPAEPGVISGRWHRELLDVDGDTYLDSWRAWARPVRVGRVVLQPPWVAAEKRSSQEIVVLLDPRRAFGSGSHPSTRLAVAALQQCTRPGDRVLDVGCGSGVLAVTAARLGARQVVALDVDPDARAAAMANAEANDVAQVVSVTAASVNDVQGSFDLVVANISAAVLTEMARDVISLVAPHGMLVLAGMLEDQAPAVVAAYRPFKPVGFAADEGWAALILRSRVTWVAWCSPTLRRRPRSMSRSFALRGCEHLGLDLTE